MNNEDANVFFFGDEATVTPPVEAVGSKAFNLMKMSKIGLPVPAGFVLSTHFCHNYFTQGRKLPPDLIEILHSNIRRLEHMARFALGGSRRPILVSVRSGAAVSMPGMMDTILNIGLSDSTLRDLIRMTGNPRLAWDSYRRLIQAYGEVVRGCPSDPFDSLLEQYLKKEEVPSAHELDVEALESLTRDYLDLFESQTGGEFPQNLIDQLAEAVEAVFKSWESPRAVEFRRLHDIRGLIGTAVIVQPMVFGNTGATSGSGVAFTRNPATGENRLYMDFLFNAQGEDVVSGRHLLQGADELNLVLPDVYKEIHRIRKILEREFKDMQDFEFTVQERKLFILQCRTGNRTPWAALQIAVDLVNEGIIDPVTALKRLEVYDLKTVERMKIVQAGAIPLSHGIPASHGVAVGEIVLDPEMAKKLEGSGRPMILVREDTSPADIGGMAVCHGILTGLGGRTSHAAVVARQMNKVCIVGCRALSIDLRSRRCTIAEKVLHEGDYISLDGNTGNIYEGKLEVVMEKPLHLLTEVEKWKTDAQVSVEPSTTPILQAQSR